MEEGNVIQANIAVYPLLQTDYRGVRLAVEALRESAVEVREGTLSTVVMGPAGAVFQAMERAFAAARSAGPTVMTVTVTDACPLPDTGEK